MAFDHKKYYKDNKEKIKQYSKDWYELNKEAKKEYNRKKI